MFAHLEQIIIFIIADVLSLIKYALTHSTTKIVGKCRLFKEIKCISKFCRHRHIINAERLANARIQIWWPKACIIR